MRLHQLLPKRARRIRIVFGVLVVLRERNGGFDLVGLADDEAVEGVARLELDALDGAGRLPGGFLRLLRPL